jgi:hypothetical protein
VTCTHTRDRSWWIENNEWDGCDGNSGNWEYTTENTTVDLDLHRYTCTQCKQIMYYSGAAKEYYETGVDRKGLFK